MQKKKLAATLLGCPLVAAPMLGAQALPSRARLCPTACRLAAAQCSPVGRRCAGTAFESPLEKIGAGSSVVFEEQPLAIYVLHSIAPRRTYVHNAPEYTHPEPSPSAQRVAAALAALFNVSSKTPKVCIV